MTKGSILAGLAPDWVQYREDEYSFRICRLLDLITIEGVFLVSFVRYRPKLLVSRTFKLGFIQLSMDGVIQVVETLVGLNDMVSNVACRGITYRWGDSLKLSGVVTASVDAVVVIVGVAAVLEICNVLHDVKKRKYRYCTLD